MLICQLLIRADFTVTDGKLCVPAVTLAVYKLEGIWLVLDQKLSNIKLMKSTRFYCFYTTF